MGLEFSGYLCPQCWSGSTIPYMGMMFKCMSCLTTFSAKDAVVDEDDDPLVGQPDEDMVIDTYTEVRQNGNWTRRTVSKYEVRTLDERYIPKRELDVARAEFFRWLFRDQVKKDKRWGRDDLKRRGYVCVGRVLVNGQPLKKWVHEDDREDEVA